MSERVRFVSVGVVGTGALVALDDQGRIWVRAVGRDTQWDMVDSPTAPRTDVSVRGQERTS